MMQPPKGDKGACSLIVSDLDSLYTPGVINSSLSFYHAMASASDHTAQHVYASSVQGAGHKVDPGARLLPASLYCFPQAQD